MFFIINLWTKSLRVRASHQTCISLVESVGFALSDMDKAIDFQERMLQFEIGRRDFRID
jgi:hypothetical protein